MAATLQFPHSESAKLESRLPPLGDDRDLRKVLPFVTLTFATSLDSALSLAPGVRTSLSGLESKAMTHYLRSRHDAICIGVNTAIADDPALNCRIDTAQSLEYQPRPIVIDPQCRWAFSESSKVLQTAREGRGLAPFIITSTAQPPSERQELLQRHGGKYIILQPDSGHEGTSGPLTRFTWQSIFRAVAQEGLKSIMVEGGGNIINSLLATPNNQLIDSVIVTIAPLWLGQGGVVVSPARTTVPGQDSAAAARLTDVSWHQLGADMVLCGKVGS